MAILKTMQHARVVLGGENKRIGDTVHELEGITQVLSDPVITLAENTSLGSETTLWHSASHAVAVDPLPSQFSHAIVAVDPDDAKSTALGVDVEVTATKSNSTDTITFVKRIDRNAALVLGSSRIGDTFTAADHATDYYEITRLRARNFNAAGAAAGDNDVDVRTLIFK